MEPFTSTFNALSAANYTSNEDICQYLRRRGVPVTLASIRRWHDGRLPRKLWPTIIAALGELWGVPPGAFIHGLNWVDTPASHATIATNLLGRTFGELVKSALRGRPEPWLADQLTQSGFYTTKQVVSSWVNKDCVPREGIRMLPILGLILKVPPELLIPKVS